MLGEVGVHPVGNIDFRKRLSCGCGWWLGEVGVHPLGKIDFGKQIRYVCGLGEVGGLPSGNIDFRKRLRCVWFRPIPPDLFLLPSLCRPPRLCSLSRLWILIARGLLLEVVWRPVRNINVVEASSPHNFIHVGTEVRKV